MVETYLFEPFDKAEEEHIDNHVRHAKVELVHEADMSVACLSRTQFSTSGTGECQRRRAHVADGMLAIRQWGTPGASTVEGAEESAGSA